MKLLVYKVRTGKNRKRDRRVINLEKLLLISAVAAFSVMIMVQILFLNPSISTFLNSNSKMDGVPLGQEEYLYKQGEIVLQLVGSNKNSDLKVLVNGDEVACFNEKKVNLTVKDGDVVEIDGSMCKNEAEVAVVSKSSNISSDILNKSVKVRSAIVKIAKLSIQ